MNKYISAGFVIALGAVLWFGVNYPHSQVLVQQLGSATGSTFGTAKVAEVVMAPTTQAATSTSILNTDSSNRWVTDGFAHCTGNSTALTNGTGAGLANLTLKAATTSTSALGIQGNPQLAANITMGTSTTYTYNSTTTPTGTIGTGAVTYLWAAGSYMSFVFNATTTSASCVVGVHYLAS
jgi:hypothetical protein